MQTILYLVGKGTLRKQDSARLLKAQPGRFHFMNFDIEKASHYVIESAYYH